MSDSSVRVVFSESKSKQALQQSKSDRRQSSTQILAGRLLPL